MPASESRYVYFCQFQTKHYLQKDTVSENVEHSKTAEEKKVEDATALSHQHLSTDDCSCNNSLQEPGTNDSKILQNDASRSLSNTCSATSNNLFTPVTLFVNSQTSLSDLVSKHHASSSSHHLMLTGLHACGNLSADILRLFVSTSSADVLCQLGCCYNLLGEKFLSCPNIPAHGNISVCSHVILVNITNVSQGSQSQLYMRATLKNCTIQWAAFIFVNDKMYSLISCVIKLSYNF